MFQVGPAPAPSCLSSAPIPTTSSFRSGLISTRQYLRLAPQSCNFNFEVGQDSHTSSPQVDPHLFPPLYTSDQTPIPAPSHLRSTSVPAPQLQVSIPTPLCLRSVPIPTTSSFRPATISTPQHLRLAPSPAALFLRLVVIPILTNLRSAHVPAPQIQASARS